MKSINTEKNELVKKLIGLCFFSAIGPRGGIGYHIKRLKENERELAKQLKSEDFNHRTLGDMEKS